jgi:tetratricopeptide (TPR) repeat protein
MRNLLILALLATLACAPAGSPNRPSDREWALLTADYQWIQTLRNAQKRPSPTASRREQIETLLENHRKLEPAYVPFMDKTRDYFERTADPRAASLLATEKIILGDDYMSVLSRYDKALELYREALSIDPNNRDAQQRIALAEQKRFVSMQAFAGVAKGMKESEVRRIVGLPREDWIKQVVERNRVYSVWIYPRADGGASAIYFDNGEVYHTNWNAAAPPAQ